jgi:hypothetical protein
MMAWRSLDFEEAGDLFYRATGYMRPGKDDARHIHSHEERAGEWNNWSVRETAKVDDALRQALAALPSESCVVVPRKLVEEAVGSLKDYASRARVGGEDIYAQHLVALSDNLREACGGG